MLAPSVEVVSTNNTMPLLKERCRPLSIVPTTYPLCRMKELAPFIDYLFVFSLDIASFPD